MTIFDQLDKCSFCDVELVPTKETSNTCAKTLSCPKDNDHCWALDWNGQGIDVLNVRCGKWQLHWDNTDPDKPITELFEPYMYQYGDSAISFPYLLDFPLTKQASGTRLIFY